jgi:PBP1b-binding outer membrane lipoprotein LpoB
MTNMKRVFLILSVSMFLTSCYTSNQYVRDNKPPRVRHRDVEVIRSAHGNHGNIFHRREQPCSDQW